MALEHRLCGPDDLDSWDELVVTLPGAHYLQLEGWLSSYRPMGFTPEVLLQCDGKQIVGGAAFLYVDLPFRIGRMFVLPHGPIFRDPAPQSRTALMTALDEHFRNSRAVYVQAWPPVARGDEGGLRLFLDAGYRQPPLFRSHVFTSTLLAVELANRGEEEILASFRPETRQHYRRAVKRGLELQLGRTHEDLLRSYELLEASAVQQGRRARPYRSLVLAFDRLVDRGRGLLVQAWKGEDLVGTMLILFAGRTATCFTSAIRRDFSWYFPMEFMHVSAMFLAKNRGMDVYDLMNWTTGSVAAFKKGFRPRETSWAAPRTKVYRPHLARLVSFAESHLRPLIRRVVRNRTSPRFRDP